MLSRPIRLHLELLVLPHHVQEPLVRVTGRVQAVTWRRGEGHDRGWQVRVRVLAPDGDAWIPSRLLR